MQMLFGHVFSLFLLLCEMKKKRLNNKVIYCRRAVDDTNMKLLVFVLASRVSRIHPITHASNVFRSSFSLV